MAIEKYLLDKRKKLLIQAVILSVIGLFFLPVSLIIFNLFFGVMGICLIMLFGFSIFSAKIWIFCNVVFFVFSVIYVMIHPNEEWVNVKFTLASAFKSESGPVRSYYAGGFLQRVAFAGMPAMTDMSDPGNWYKQIQRLANVLTNLTFACPRKIQESLPFYWLYFKCNQSALIGLDNLIKNLKQAGGDYDTSNPQINLRWLPLAIELDLVHLVKKKDTDGYLVSLSAL